MQKGLIHIYTGDGKGKTTSAVGLAVRALGHDMKVCYAYFHKRPEKYGYTEIKNLKKLGAKVIGFAKGHPFCDKELKTETLEKEARNGIEELKKIVVADDLDMLIMDEILISVRDHFLVEEVLIEFINSKPEKLELIMTGRGATKNLIELADYVSEIKKVKHPFDQKITSREGIEY